MSYARSLLMLPFIYRVIFFLLLFLPLVPNIAFAESKGTFEALRIEYLHLRNTDVQIKKVAEWSLLSKKLQEFAIKNSSDPDAPTSCLYAAILSEQRYKKTKEKTLFDNTIAELDYLVNTFPKSDICDEALVRKGDLLLYEAEDIAGAKAVYNAMLDSYGSFDMAEVARSRLKSIESGEYQAYLDAKKANNQGLPKVDSKKPGKFLVAIDPGHGGEDFGAKGIGGLLEKDITFAVALELEKLLMKEPGISVKLTRHKDTFIPLANRVQYANEVEADLLISLHTNASETKKASGVETYYLDNKGDEASRLLVDRENGTEGVRQGDQSDLDFMLGDLVQDGKVRDSVVLAHFVQRALVNNLRVKWDDLRDLGVKRAPFFILVGTHMPCVLVELFFIDNPDDGDKLGKNEFRAQVAMALRDSIVEYRMRQQDKD
jgi:N-acetylmuramoyl-L-alanine amidase